MVLPLPKQLDFFIFAALNKRKMTPKNTNAQLRPVAKAKSTKSRKTSEIQNNADSPTPKRVFGQLTAWADVWEHAFDEDLKA